MGNILLLRTPLSIQDLGLLIGFRPDEIIEPLQGIGSILVIPHDNNQAIRPFHASLRDFFMDRNRSKGLFIDPAGIHFGLVLSCIMTIPKCLSENGNLGDSSNATAYAFSSWCYHLNLTLVHGGGAFLLQPEKCLILVNGLQVVCDVFEHWDKKLEWWLEQHQMIKDLNSVLLKLKVSLAAT